ncbi:MULTISPECIES: hypothetical protein, partial [unclassified Aeromonas]|uniref:hypothetical protein n=1 Tax=unclassified Aeromonas TaxID=257493 RepID=UPI0022E2943A
MAKTNISGLKELNDLLDSLTEPKFRGRALRNSAAASMESVKQEMINSLPTNMKPDDVVLKTKVNTDKKILITHDPQPASRADMASEGLPRLHA